MQQKQAPSPERLAPIIWGAQLTSAVMLTGLALLLPNLIEIEPIEGLTLPLLIGAVAAVAATFIVAKVLGVTRRAGGVNVRKIGTSRDKPTASPSAIGFYLAVLGLAELPAILGIVYVFAGGPTLHALGLGTLSVAIILAFTPQLITSNQR